jgi:hypothetical protein
MQPWNFRADCIAAEASGSRSCARKICDLGRECDVMASADYAVVSALLMPEHAEFNIHFARGEGVLFCSRTPTLNAVADDPDDDKFIECAVALEAGVVVSGDKALTAVENYAEIRILTPRQFLDWAETPAAV